MANRVGQQFGNYLLTRLLGHGGFAEVYLAEHIHLNTQAAIKVLHTRLESHDLEQFRIEARTIARLKHPHIVRVLEFGVEDGIPFLVMDYVPNGSLRQRHPDGIPLSLVTIVPYVKQVADAVQFIHNQKLIHRDIKPQNLLLGSNNEVLLSDFGIALVTQSSSLQGPQNVAGTVAYMAPEQLQGKPRPASDQYALGIVVYEWLTGIRPFKGSYGEIASQHALVPPPPLHEKVSAISPDVEQVVLKALAKDPRQRFASVQDFANALEQASQPKPILLSASPSVSSPRVNASNFVRTTPTDPIVDDEFEDLDSAQTIPPLAAHPSTLPIRAAPAGNRSPAVQSPVSLRPRILPAGSRPTGRGTPAASTPPRTTRRAGYGVGAGRPATMAQPHRSAAAGRSSRSIILIPAIVLLLLLIAALAYGYFVPSADVTITLPSQNFSIPLALTATATSQQDAAHQTVRAQTVVFDASMSKTGPATGSKQVGTTPATGQVVFTNHGNQSVHIPLGTIVATKSGVQFMTTTDVLVLTVSSNIGNTISDLVQAQSLGQSGNVPANSITVISPASLSKLAQVNGNATLNISVTNPDAFTNGGLGTATAVTQNDIQTLKTALDQQLQQQTKAWLAGQVHNGDVAGQPVQMETSFATPAVGQVATNGTITEHVSLHMTVLIVRAADLQAVAQAVFNAAASKFKADYALAPQQMLSLVQATSKSCTPSIGTTSLTLCYSASGRIAPKIPVQQVRDALAWKTVKDAMDYLKSITNSVGGATTQLVITIHPGFFPWLPFWSQHITIHVNIVPPK